MVDTSQERQVGALDSFAHDGERFFRDIDELVESWNHWATVIGLSDYENYINGHIKFLFEYVCGVPIRLMQTPTRASICSS